MQGDSTKARANNKVRTKRLKGFTSSAGVAINDLNAVTAIVPGGQADRDDVLRIGETAVVASSSG